MDKRKSDSIKAVLILLALISVVRLVGGLPWWFFVVPVVSLGSIAAWRDWRFPSFGVGFFAGFLLWSGLNACFSGMGNGLMLTKVGHLLMVNQVVIILASGILGGLLTGLALYAGKTIVAAPPR